MLSSCISKEEFEALQKKQQETEASLNEANEKLDTTTKERDEALTELSALKEQVAFLKESNRSLIDNVGGLTMLTQKGAENLEMSLESLKEKDVQIKSLQDAVTRRDSVAFALVSSLKGVLGNLNDDDIEINVEKGVVYVSISDKLLFRSGSFVVTRRAKTILGKIAKILKEKSDIEFLVEGHTDSVPVKKEAIPNVIDNWDLSVKRATSVVRVLQYNFKVDPKRMTAAGRSYYNPKNSNKTRSNRAKNRRTRIVILPKLDQFTKLIEDGFAKAK